MIVERRSQRSALLSSRLLRRRPLTSLRPALPQRSRLVFYRRMSTFSPKPRSPASSPLLRRDTSASSRAAWSPGPHNSLGLVTSPPATDKGKASWPAVATATGRAEGKGDHGREGDDPDALLRRLAVGEVRKVEAKLRWVPLISSVDSLRGG